MANQALYYLVTGRNPGRHGNAHASIVPYQAFATRNGDITVAGGNDGQFQRMCAVLGEPMLADDPRYATNAGRVAHRGELISVLQVLFAQWDQADILMALEAAGVPAGPINTLEQVFADPQVQHRGMAFTQESPVMGQVPGVRSPLLFSGAEVGAALPPPALGAHTRAVLSETLGLNDAALADLTARAVIS